MKGFATASLFSVTLLLAQKHTVVQKTTQQPIHREGRPLNGNRSTSLRIHWTENALNNRIKRNQKRQ